jgi:hypothetical protein
LRAYIAGYVTPRLAPKTCVRAALPTVADWSVICLRCRLHLRSDHVLSRTCLVPQLETVFVLEGLGPAQEEGDDRPQPSAGSFEDQVLHRYPIPYTISPRLPQRRRVSGQCCEYNLGSRPGVELR